MQSQRRLLELRIAHKILDYEDYSQSLTLNDSLDEWHLDLCLMKLRTEKSDEMRNHEIISSI
jgi:hypothetical protein